MTQASSKPALPKVMCKAVKKSPRAPTFVLPPYNSDRVAALREGVSGTCRWEETAEDILYLIELTYLFHGDPLSLLRRTFPRFNWFLWDLERPESEQNTMPDRAKVLKRMIGAVDYFWPISPKPSCRYYIGAVRHQPLTPRFSIFGHGVLFTEMDIDDPYLTLAHEARTLGAKDFHPADQLEAANDVVNSRQANATGTVHHTATKALL